MEQQLARPDGIDVIAVPRFVGADVHVMHPHLVALDACEGILEVGLPLADRLDLRSGEHDASLVALLNLVFVPCLAIDRNHFLAFFAHFLRAFALVPTRLRG